MSSAEKFAKILKVKPDILNRLEIKLNTVTGKNGVFDKIIEEINNRVSLILKAFNLKFDSPAEEVYKAWINKVGKEDEALFKIFKEPDFSETLGCATVINSAKELSGNLNGFFIKEERARELLEKNPPKNVLKITGYNTVGGLLEKENLLDVFAALRFVEDAEWLNKTFFSEYRNLNEGDFETRPIEARVLREEWKARAQKYTGHKLHHISHLKELGFIFIIPFQKNYPGATLEVFTLLLHYFHEVDFYSRLFKKYSREQNFAEKMISALRGDIPDKIFSGHNGLSVPIVQRYLAKDNPDDPRLFVPHVNPEVIHWAKGEADIVRQGERFTESDLEFFRDLDFVAKFFESKKFGGEIILSFDPIDGVVSLARVPEIGRRYYYHQHEALWNKIFDEYFGAEKIEQLILGSLDRGEIVLA